MKQFIEIEIWRKQVCLLGEVFPVDGTLRNMTFGNVGEDMSLAIVVKEQPDYPEPADDGWYYCGSKTCNTMFRKSGGMWLMYREDLTPRMMDWETLYECEADCVRGKGLERVM